MATDPKSEMNTIASHLRALHKLLLDHEKRIYEKTFGRIENPYQLLDLAMNDPQFAWLRALSGEMVNLDEVRLRRGGVTDADLRLIGTRLRALFVTHGKVTSFQQHLDDARNEDPSILLAQKALVASFPPEAKVELFVSAGDEQDSKDPLPAAIRPGTLVPGFGDKGYYAIGAIEERGLLANVPIKSVRYTNETVLEIASVSANWTVNNESFTTSAWEPVAVNAGSGSAVSRTPQGDGVSVSIYIRQQELGGDARTSRPSGIETDSTILLADEEVLGNDLRVYARLEKPDTLVKVPEETDHDALIYVVAGGIEIDGVEIPDSRLALVRDPQNLSYRTTSDAMVLVILVKPDAKITRAGSFAR